MIPKKRLTVIRQQRTTFVDGFAIPHPSSSFVVSASVQPASERDLKLLPEGSHYEEAYTLFTHDYFQEEDSAYEADTVIVFGKNYKVVKVSDWDNALIPHRKVVVIR